VDEGAHRHREVFLTVWQREGRPFLGDQSASAILARLVEAAHPLIARARSATACG
jgi:hypothetical protein